MTVSKLSRLKSLKNPDKGRCTNCYKPYDGPNGCGGGNKISWYDRISSEERNITIGDAISIIFEGLLKMNNTKIDPTEDVSMCYDCLFNVSELYRNYREFMGRTVPASFTKELFGNCILWPNKQNTVSEIKEKDESGLQLSENDDADATEETEDIIDGCAALFDVQEIINEIAIKTEIEDNDNFDYLSEIGFSAEDSGDEQSNSNNVRTSDLLTNDVITNNIRYSRHRKVERGSNVVQLPNGKWYIPKEAKILLRKYTPGKTCSLDLGKAVSQFLGREIKVGNGTVLKIPQNKIYFYQCLAKQKLLAQGFTKSCKFCREVFTKKELYDEHIKNHQEGEKNKFQCAKCGKEHISLKSLWNHSRTAHLPEKKYACLHCGKGFPLLDYLKAHIHEVHYQSKEERELKNKARYERIKKNPRPRIKKKSKKWLEVHPGEIDKVTCEYCGKVLASPYMKAHHVFTLHKPESERPFGCQFCERRFPTKGLKETHEKGHHLDTREYKCEICGKTFVTSSSLQNHIKTHSDDRTCICEHCGKRYKHQIALQKHIFVIHEVKGRTHACDICNATFKTQDAMKTHKRGIHSSTDQSCLCFECGLKLKTKKIWEIHMLNSHGMNAEFVCNVCSRGFNKAREYEEHMAKGSHIKPLWMRPESQRKKRNYKVPSYARAKVQKKLERRIIRREKEGLLPLTENEKELFIKNGMKEYGVGTEPLRKRNKPTKNLQPQQMPIIPIYNYL